MNIPINILSLGGLLSILIITLPVLGVALSFIAGAVWQFIWRLDKIPDNYVLSLFKKVTTPVYKIETMKEHCGAVRFAIKNSEGKYWDVVYNDFYILNRDSYFRSEVIAESTLRRISVPKCNNYFLWIFPLAIVTFLISALLHYQFWITVYVLSFVASLFVVRWICDLQKYAQQVKQQLDSHKTDPEAHKEVS